MIKRIRAYVRGVLEVRRVKRAFLAAQDGPAIWLAGGEPVGATLDWSPIADVEHAIEHEQEDEARAELAAAEADLKPLLDDFQRRMAKAFRAFDAALVRPMTTTARWHMAGRDCCQKCAEEHARQFGAIGERLGIRSFRIDPPTAEYRVIGTDRVHARELVPA